MRNINRILLLAILVATLMSIACARIVKPPGGPKDATAPSVLGGSPNHKSVNFDGNKIVLEFDEFIRIDDIENQLVISPMMDPRPDIYMKGKKLHIRLNAPLDENTTYNLNFGDALKDITEGNPLSNFQYTMATGAILDSMSISGIVKDAFTGMGVEEMWVMLYKSGPDSTFKHKKPNYIAKTREDGTFAFNALPNTTFEIYALDDQNSNLIYDLPNERIAFVETNITIDTSNIYDISLYAFIEKEDKAILKDVKQSGYSKFTLNYSKYVDDVNIDFIENVDFIIEKHDSREKDILWLMEKPDSITNLLVNGEDILTDTSRLIFSDKFDTKPDSLYIVKEGSSKTKPSSSKKETDKPILIFFNTPIAKTGQAVLSQDGNSIEISETTIGENPRSISLSADLEEEQSYKIFFTELPIDVYGNELTQKDSIEISTMSLEDYSTLILEVQNYDSLANYKAGLYSELNPNTMIRPIPIDTDSITTVSGIFPGKYYLIVYDDENSNQVWDKGSYEEDRLSERSWSLSKQLHFKEKFEVESTIDLE